MKRITMVLLSLLIAGCSSKEPQYYVLNPVYAPSAGQAYVNLRLGIDEVNIPEYLDKSPLIIFCTANQSSTLEHHEWGEELSGNVRRVIRTNLSTFLPGALIENAPWDIKFKPNYQLDVNITQFKVDTQGHSILAADYVIYLNNQALKKYRVSYSETITTINAQAMVVSMNNNLTRLTRDIAKNMPRT